MLPRTGGRSGVPRRGASGDLEVCAPQFCYLGVPSASRTLLQLTKTNSASCRHLNLSCREVVPSNFAQVGQSIRKKRFTGSLRKSYGLSTNSLRLAPLRQGVCKNPHHPRRGPLALRDYSPLAIQNPHHYSQRASTPAHVNRKLK